MIDRITRAIDRLCEAGAAVAAVIMLLMTGHILLEIVLRGAFRTSTFVVDEFVGYGIAAMTFLALAHTLNKNGHIRVSLLKGGAPKAAHQAMELLAIAVALAIWCFVTWYIGKTVLANYNRGIVSETVARTPLWVPQLANLAGLVLLLLALIGRGLRVLSGKRTETLGGDYEHH